MRRRIMASLRLLLEHLALPFLHHPGIAGPLESDEAQHVGGERDQARLEQPRAVSIGAE